MVLQLDSFKDSYVVVPKFKNGSEGIVSVDRGDMTDKEWKRWLSVSGVPDVKRAINEFKRGKTSIVLLSKHLIDFLESKGISACLTCTMRPSDEI